MKVALVAFGLLSVTGCARATEGMVREQAAAAFSCADYALHVEEVGPEVYRASGCGQELIYACRAVATGPTAQHHRRRPRAEEAAEPGEIADIGSDPVMECFRRPQ